MENVKVSVIIPVYNTAPYLKEAIGSVLCQSLADIEVIAVNDGSSDNSLQILNELAETDKRLKVISYEKNVGVSICRNTGLEAARGEFIYFFDSDDIIEIDCLELCYKKMLESDYDFIVFDGLSFSEVGVKAGFNASYQRTRLFKQDVYSGKSVINMLIAEKSYSCSVCLCFIRKDFLLQNQLSFHPGVLYEDVLYAAKMYLSASQVSFVPRTFFHRRVRENSTMTSRVTPLNIGYRFTVANELLKLKSVFADKQSTRVLNHQARNLFVFLIKSLIRNRQFGLLMKYLLKIKLMILRSL